LQEDSEASVARLIPLNPTEQVSTAITHLFQAKDEVDTPFYNVFRQISLLYREFQFTMSNVPTNALVCNKTLIQMSHIKTLKITPTCSDHQLIIIRELFDPG
jgi:hypothetical protein